jgi:hypothetical protein
MVLTREGSLPVRPNCLRSSFVKAVPLFHRGEVSNVSPRKATLNTVSEVAGNMVFTSLCMLGVRIRWWHFRSRLQARFVENRRHGRGARLANGIRSRCSPCNCCRYQGPGNAPFESHHKPFVFRDHRTYPLVGLLSFVRDEYYGALDAIR